jgi:hypothetical protein
MRKLALHLDEDSGLAREYCAIKNKSLTGAGYGAAQKGIKDGSVL